MKMRLAWGVLCLALAAALSNPATAATFTLRCVVDGETGEMDFLFDTRSKEVLQRRVSGNVQLAKYQTLDMTYAQVIFAKYALMGAPKQKFKTSRAGGPLYESIRKGSWSDWKKIGACRKM